VPHAQTLSQHVERLAQLLMSFRQPAQGQQHLSLGCRRAGGVRVVGGGGGVGGGG
jgi:hypothetical protein